VGDLVGEEAGMNDVAGAVGVKGLVVGVKVEVMEGVMEGVMGVEMGVETVGVGMEEVVVRGTSRRFDGSWICMQGRPQTMVTCMCIQSDHVSSMMIGKALQSDAAGVALAAELSKQPAYLR